MAYDTVKNTERKRRARARRRASLDGLKSDGCLLCEEQELCCLDFHHIGEKRLAISAAVAHHTHSIESIIEEAKKCVVLCKNCHAKAHAGVVVLDMEGYT
jgi:hypothetical protein